MSIPAKAQQWLNNAMQLMQQGKFADALPLFLKLEQAGLNDSRLYRSIGVAYERLHQVQQAINYFNRSLALAPQQVDLLQSLVRLNQQNGDWDAAVSCAKKMSTMQPGIPADIALGFLYLRLPSPDYVNAKACFSRVIKHQPVHPDALVGLARIAVAQHKESEAQDFLERACNHHPGYKFAINELAWFYKNQGNFKAAFEQFSRLVDSLECSADDIENLALCQLDLADTQHALNTVDSGLQRFPTHRGLLKLRGALSWEMGQIDHLSHYRRVLSASHSPDIALDFAEQLITAEQYEEAQSVLSSLASTIDSAAVTRRQVSLNYRLERYGDCIAQLTSLEKHTPLSQSDRENRVLALLAMGECEAAAKDIDQMLMSAPNDQFIWALRGIQWRLQNDERYDWLCDYKMLVKHTELVLPPGFNSLSAFTNELKDTLLTLHNTKQSPLEQSLKKGTQTPGHLLNHQIPIIRALRQALSLTAQSMLEMLPYDSTHPTLKFTGRKLDFSASWSVNLHEQGFHVSHVHPKGWYSSAFYVSVPETLTEKDRQGWLHLGKPGVATPYALGVEHWVKPQAGTLALFPSFMWHGTEPYSGRHHRMTVAFDLVPDIGKE